MPARLFNLDLTKESVCVSLLFLDERLSLFDESLIEKMVDSLVYGPALALCYSVVLSSFLPSFCFNLNVVRLHLIALLFL